MTITSCRGKIVRSGGLQVRRIISSGHVFFISCSPPQHRTCGPRRRKEPFLMAPPTCAILAVPSEPRLRATSHRGSRSQRKLHGERARLSGALPEAHGALRQGHRGPYGAPGTRGPSRPSNGLPRWHLRSAKDETRRDETV